MIEFISLCVCSACLSCICCLVTGGLCIMPAAVRLRNKIVEKHLPGGWQWLGNMPQSDVCRCSSSSSSSSSDRCSMCRVSREEERSNCEISEEVEGHDTKEYSGVTEVDENKSSRPRSKTAKTSAVKSRNRSSSRGWTFCFRRGKPGQESSQCCVPIEEDKKVPEPRSSRHKKSKNSRTRKNESETYCAYFKSCSCTDVKEPSRKRHCKRSKRPEMSAARCAAECHRVKRRSKGSRKSVTCPKNCQCKVVADTNTSVCYVEKKVKQNCKCSCRSKRPCSPRCCSK